VDRRHDRRRGESTGRAVIEHPIVLRELEDVGIRLPLWGRFANSELTYALAIMPDGKARCWCREPRGECAQIFAARVARDICERVYADRCPVLLTG
jgi:hypothetical protein